MELPLTITAQDITLPASIEAIIREKAFKLERFYDRLIGCHVRVAGPGRHHRNGGLFDVRIDLSVPGSELVVNDQHILTVEHTPDTMVTLTTGLHLMVRESVAEVIDRVTHFRRRLHAGPLHVVEDP